MKLQSWSGRFWRPAALVGAVAACLVGLGATPGLVAASHAAAASAPVSVVAAQPAVTSYADGVNRAVPAVVTVRIDRKAEMLPSAFDEDPFQRFFRGDGRQGRSQPAPVQRALGSGVIVTSDGNILTNNHVVDGAEHVTVVLADGREFPARVVGTDSATDLAVVHIDAKNLPAIPLGDSDRVRVGDVVLAVGNPLGVGETVTMGIISAKGRTTGTNGNYEDFLQTDAPINQGNSGGALITASGELIGINSQILSNGSGGNIGIGFAIPSNMARQVMAQLVTTGHVRRAILGVTVQPMTSDLAKSMGLDTVHGALVNSVEPGGPAAEAGIMKGDLIVSLDGKTAEDANQLRNRVSAMAPGSTVSIEFERHGARQHAKVTLGELPDASRRATGPSSGGADFGMSFEPLTPSLAQELQLPLGATGVAVTDVDPAGAAARAGIQAGDVVQEVDGRTVTSSAAVREALTRHTDGPALLYVHRGNAGFYVALPASNS